MLRIIEGPNDEWYIINTSCTAEKLKLHVFIENFNLFTIAKFGIQKMLNENEILNVKFRRVC